MRFGFVGSYGTAAQMVEIGEAAERHGWDGFFSWDRVSLTSTPEWAGLPLAQVDAWDPAVLLGVVASRTRRIRLGAIVFAVPRREPWKFAREALTVDHLSGGRGGHARPRLRGRGCDLVRRGVLASRHGHARVPARARPLRAAPAQACGPRPSVTSTGRAARIGTWGKCLAGSVSGRHDARVCSKAVISASCWRVRPMSSRPSSRRQRV